MKLQEKKKAKIKSVLKCWLERTQRRKVPINSRPVWLINLTNPDKEFLSLDPLEKELLTMTSSENPGLVLQKWHSTLE